MIIKTTYKEIIDPLLNIYLPKIKESLQSRIEEDPYMEIFPVKEDIWAAFNTHSLEDLKVIVLGQDPYHTPGVANGLAFSVSKPKYCPPSLRNIIQELEDDLGQDITRTKALSKKDYRAV